MQFSKMRYRLIAYIALWSSIPFLLSCNSDSHSTKSGPHDLYQEVMKIHDDVMPKMSDIRREISRSKNVLQNIGLNQKEDSVALTKIIRDLEYADQIMWDWMHEFDKEKGLSEGAESYLLEQKKAISHVSQRMLASIENSKKYHEKH